MVIGFLEVDAYDHRVKSICMVSPRLRVSSTKMELIGIRQGLITCSHNRMLRISNKLLGGPGTDNFLAWNFTNNGVFTVRLAYYLRMDMKKCKSDQPEPSSSVDRHKGFMALWGTNAPNKAKVHLWRMIRNGLAVGSELHFVGLNRVFSVLFVAEKRQSSTGYGRVTTRLFSGRSCNLRQGRS